MVIGIDASRANLIHKTGTEWYAFYLIKNLAKIDSENKYILYLNKEPSIDLQAAVESNSNFSFKVLKWPLYSFWTLGRLSWEMIWHRPDILFIPAHTMPLIYPKKTINTIHDIAFFRESNLYRSDQVKTSKLIFKKIIELIVRVITRGKYRSGSLDYLYWATDFALRKAKKIITVSNFTKEDILKAYPEVKADKIKIVHNGYNHELYKVINDDDKIRSILEKYGLEKPYFLYVGRIEKKKNIPLLIESLSFLRDNYPQITEKMVLIGDASFGYDEVKYVIEEFNLNKEVLMPGWVDEADLPYIFNGATAFVFPSKHEGFGIPILQAMACGVPIAASDIAVFHEVAANSILYFDNTSRSAIANALAKIVQDDNIKQQLKASGLVTCQNFSWEKCARETLVEILNT